MNIVHILSPVQGQNNMTTYQQGNNQSQANVNAQNATAQGHFAYADSGQVNTSKLSQAVDRINQQLADAATRVEIKFDPKSQLYWLNIVNKSTGKVVSEFPPEAVRKIVDSLTTSGISVDVKG